MQIPFLQEKWYLHLIIQDSHMNKPTIDELLKVLRDEITFSSSIIRDTDYNNAEKRTQNSLIKQLKNIYLNENVDEEYAIGGHKTCRIDVDLFNGTYGIELKVAHQLSKFSNVLRLLGQVVYYNKKHYHGNMIVMVVGKEKDKDAALKEVAQYIEELGVHFIYKIV